MKLFGKNGRENGFTLIELLVVIGIIALLFTLVSPQVNKARFKSKLTQSASKAREIVSAIIASEGTSRFSRGTAWPSSDAEDAASSSTEFLAKLVEDGHLDVDYGWFAGPGMPQARNREEFISGGSKYNAWCIMLNINDTTPGNYPVVFTRNLTSIGSGGSLTFDEKAVPFGNKGFAFATKNGEGVSVEEADITSGDVKDIFNIGSADDENASVSFLSP